MTSSTIIDTGPIVAYLNKADMYHEWAINQFGQLKPPFFTCEAVISEACFLLRHTTAGQQNILKFVERDLIQVVFKLDSESKAISKLLTKYRDIPMSFADACLVRMAEQVENSAICTIDSDFKIYRKGGRKTIPLIFP